MMDTNLKQVAQQMLESTMSSSMVDGVDSGDKYVSDVSEDGKVTFNMSKSIDRIVPGRRGPGSLEPLGHIEYKVTVEARWVPMEDADDEG